MQVTHIFKTYFPDTHGGMEEAIRQISKATVEKKITTLVVSLSKEPKESVQDGVITKSFYNDFEFFSNPFSWALVKNFRKIIKRSDIIHLHFPWPTVELLVLLFNVKKPIVLTFQCDIHNNRFLRKIISPFIHAILQKSNVIIPSTDNLLKSTPILKGYKEKCCVISMWLDEDRFKDLPLPSSVIKRKIEQLGDYALFIGVLRWYKGLDVLIDAANEISGNIVIVGKGPLLDALKNRIEKEKITNVFIIGFQNDGDLKYLLKKCKFTILPSTSPAEAFGQVLLESCYFKKPMVTTELGTGTSFINLNNKTGYVVPPNHATLLAEAMNKLFTSTSICSRFGQNAYTRLQENFTYEKQAGKYIKIYKNLFLGIKK